MIELVLSSLLLTGAYGVGRRCLRRLGHVRPDGVQEGCFSVALGFGVLAAVVFGLGVTHQLFEAPPQNLWVKGPASADGHRGSRG